MNANSPEARVQAFVTDYFEAWTEFYERSGEGEDSQNWSDAIDNLQAEHYRPGAVCEEQHYSGAMSRHHPEEENIIEAEGRGESATVLTRRGADFYEYTLHRMAGDWKIFRIRETDSHPKAPLLDDDQVHRLVRQTSFETRLGELSEQEDPSHSLFEAGRVVSSSRGKERLRVDRVGELRITSGVLGVQDFGYDASFLTPLARRVNPGRYSVEVSRVYGRNAGFRILFQPPERVARWHPAANVDGNHVFGVDTANLSVVDLISFASLTDVRKERLYKDGLINPRQRPAATLISMKYEKDGVIVQSGWGDGAYPCHWGVDEDGNVAVLLVDFLVVAEWRKKKTRLRFAASDVGTVLSNELTSEYEIEVRVDVNDDGTGELVVVAGATPDIMLLDQQGEPLVQAPPFGGLPFDSSYQSGRKVWFLPREVMDRAPWVIELGMNDGYRNG